MTTSTPTRQPDRVHSYDTVTAATMALGSKTYSGTVAAGSSTAVSPTGTQQ